MLEVTLVDAVNVSIEDSYLLPLHEGDIGAVGTFSGWPLDPNQTVHAGGTLRPLPMATIVPKAQDPQTRDINVVLHLRIHQLPTSFEAYRLVYEVGGVVYAEEGGGRWVGRSNCLEDDPDDDNDG